MPLKQSALSNEISSQTLCPYFVIIFFTFALFSSSSHYFLLFFSLVNFFLPSFSLSSPPYFFSLLLLLLLILTSFPLHCFYVLPLFMVLVIQQMTLVDFNCISIPGLFFSCCCYGHLFSFLGVIF